jgi:hypothetical protein
MHTPVVNVARSRFLDIDKFIEFAENNRATYYISGDGENAVVGTWYVNDLVDAFKIHLGEEYQIDREANIQSVLQSIAPRV